MIPARGYLVPAIVILLLILVGSQAWAETGMASFYGGPRHHGKPMANGKLFDQMSDSCAHKSIPFGTALRVTTRSGRSVVCIVRDRGPFRRGRIVDLSVAHARDLRMVGAGVLPVTVEKR